MSTDFIALFDIRADGFTLEGLCATLQAKPDLVAELAKEYERVFKWKTWAIELWLPDRRPRLVGPGGFVIDHEDHMLELWHGIRFSMFTGDLWHRTVLRGVCLVVADSVGSERAIYTHELMPHSGHANLNAVEESLRTQIGPPAASFEELNEAKYFGPRAWYIEDFRDLREAGLPRR